MKILIKTIKGETFNLEVEPAETVNNEKAAFLACE
jgi:hypothetical protein